MKSLLLPIQYALEKLLFGSRCQSCKRPGNDLCFSCLQKIPLAKATEHADIYGIYDYGNHIVHDAIWSLKYYHKGVVAKALTEHAHEIIQEIIFETLQSSSPENIILVPIPQYKKKQQKRGVNQSEKIAQWIATHIDHSSVAILLHKDRETIPQARIGHRADRIKNVAQTFSLESGVLIQKNVLYILVDDVTTTGATFLEGMRVLREHGAEKVIAIALAHGYRTR